MIQQYVQGIRNNGGKLPVGWKGDPRPMQIAKLDDALRKAKSAQK